MARGADNQPDEKHWALGTKCEIVLYEQSKHRDASRANGDGYAVGRGGARSWQSHHLACVSAMADREAKDPPSTALMEKSLYITKWNINEAPNMIGLPMYRLYMKKYGAIARKPKASQDAAYGSIIPTNWPAHDVDHNTTNGFTDTVKVHLKSKIWNKFNAKGGDHKKDAEWLADKLKKASKTFQGWLEDHGVRKSGTVKAWKNRFNDPDWVHPFSMADVPTQRHAGKSFRDLLEIFSKL